MGEELLCGREVDNPHDPYAVSVLKRRWIMGHVPRSISRPYSVILWSHGRTFLQVLQQCHFNYKKIVNSCPNFSGETFAV